MVFFRNMRKELEARISAARTHENVAKRERDIWENRNRTLDAREQQLQLRADDLDRREQELIKEQVRLEGLYPEFFHQSG